MKFLYIFAVRYFYISIMVSLCHQQAFSSSAKRLVAANQYLRGDEVVPQRRRSSTLGVTRDNFSKVFERKFQ